MLRSMTAHQLREWLVFMDKEPFGEDREDIRNGIIVQTLLNIHRDRKRKPKAFTLAECVVPGGDAFSAKVARPRQSWQEMKMIAMFLAPNQGEN